MDYVLFYIVINPSMLFLQCHANKQTNGDSKNG
jgi:hypothetical protein